MGGFSTSELAHALQESLFIRWFSGTLGLPQDQAEAFHHFVFCLVGIACLQRDFLVQATYPGGPVAAELLGKGDVHAHVQEGVGLAVCDIEVALQNLWIADERMVLGVLLDHLRDNLFNARERGIRASLVPDQLEKTA
jgi:hypothetical protein